MAKHKHNNQLLHKQIDEWKCRLTEKCWAIGSKSPEIPRWAMQMMSWHLHPHIRNICWLGAGTSINVGNIPSTSGGSSGPGTKQIDQRVSGDWGFLSFSEPVWIGLHGPHKRPHKGLPLAVGWQSADSYRQQLPRSAVPPDHRSLNTDPHPDYALTFYDRAE